jgi:toxin-antitoxin system PIN domain toxin
VILLDVNVVLAAHRQDHPHHATVRPWFDGLVRGDDRFSVPDVVWASFVRIATNRRIFHVPTSLEEAFEFLRSVRSQSGYVATTPGPRHLGVFETLCNEGDAMGDLAADAYLAALAVDQGAEVISLDRDFARFPGLRWRLPESG